MLSRTDLTLQALIDEAQALELSARSAAEIRNQLGSVVTSKPATMHHDEVDSDQSSEDEEDVSHLKTTSSVGKRRKESL